MATTMWTFETMQDAQDKQQFIYVGDIHNRNVTIMDASGLWKWNPDAIFHTGYRIAGTAEEIRAALEEAGVEPEDVEAVLESGITSSNHEGDFEDVFETEVKAFDQWRRSAIQANLDAPGLKLYDMMARINPAMTQKTGGTTRRSPGRKTGGRKTVSLQSRVDTLETGKVLNVSKMQPTGTGARKTNEPSERSKFKGIADLDSLPIVSDNLEAYLLALSMLDGGEEAHADAAAEMRQVFSGAGTAARTLKAKSPATRLRATPPATRPSPAARLKANPPTGFEAYTAPPPATTLERKHVPPMLNAAQRRQQAGEKTLRVPKIPALPKEEDELPDEDDDLPQEDEDYDSDLEDE